MTDTQKIRFALRVANEGLKTETPEADRQRFIKWLLFTVLRGIAVD